jgi:hypothetical protein
MCRARELVSFLPCISHICCECHAPILNNDCREHVPSHVGWYFGYVLAFVHRGVRAQAKLFFTCVHRRFELQF